jgi:hypothetical protein
MKTILILLLSAMGLLAADKQPAVGVYLIRKFEVTAAVPQMPATILEISNPTDQTYYVNGHAMEQPFHDREVKRGEKWLMMPRSACGTASEFYPLRPGAKMLVTVDVPWDEVVTRFRFYFYTTEDQKTAKVIAVRSRAIERKELGDLTGTTGETTSDAKLEEPLTDEEINR